MRIALVACLFLCSSSIVSADPAPHYQLAHKFVLGGDGGWDALTYDPAGKRLFISRATRVMVMDVEKGALLGEIPDTAGVHDIALAPELGKGYTSNGKDNTVTVFDLKTLKSLTRINVSGQNPDAIVYEPATKRVFAFDGHSNDATVIDATNDKVTATIPFDGNPEFAVADGEGRVYVNIEDKSEVSLIDARSAKVIKTWSIAPCDGPSGIGLDANHHRVFSGCHNKLMAVSDAETGKVVATLPIGEGVDGAGFDPGTGYAFSSNGGDGTLTVIHEDAPDKYSVVENAATQKFARTMTLNPDNHDVYLLTAEVHVTPAPAGATGQAARPKRDVLPGTFAVLVMHRQ
ncbi:MAG: YncE family protein [Bacillota bacterium]